MVTYLEPHETNGVAFIHCIHSGQFYTAVEATGYCLYGLQSPVEKATNVMASATSLPFQTSREPIYLYWGTQDYVMNSVLLT